MATDINKYYGLQLLCFFITTFTTVTTYLYYCIRSYVHQTANADEDSEVLPTALWSFYHGIRIIAVCFIAHKTTAEVI